MQITEIIKEHMKGISLLEQEHLLITIATIILVVLQKAKNKVQVLILGLVAQNILEIGKMI